MQLAVRAPETVEVRPWRPHVALLVLIPSALIGGLLGAILSLAVARGPTAGYEYHLWRWQADTFASTVFARLGIGPDPVGEDAQRALEQYFTLTSQIRAELDSPSPDLNLLDVLASERITYENDVERVVERYVDDAIKSVGLQRGLPLFSSVLITWPPVAIELTSPPSLLVRSPRDRIERAGDTLLRNDLTLRDIERIEQRTDSDDTVSLVVPIGGIAAYPAIIREDRTYWSLVETAAHEWVHHYLAFYPLGRTWGTGGDSYALNETTAELAGRELANVVHRLHPVQLDPSTDGRAPARAAPTVDFTPEMRQLRLDVDALLAEGLVTEAEALMEEKRLYLAENGILIRKINQAYFAFYGTYADSPQSSDPIGPMVNRVWELTGDVGVFLRVMREVTSVADLEALIAGLETITR